MELPEILKQTIVFLDDEQIYSLFSDPLKKESVKAVLADNDFWYRRTSYYLGYEIEANNGFNWKRIYYHVREECWVTDYALGTDVDIETFDVLAQNPNIDDDVLYTLSLSISEKENVQTVLMLQILFRYIVVESKAYCYINLILRAVRHSRIDTLRFLLTKFNKISTEKIVMLCKETFRTNIKEMLQLLEILFEYPVISDNVDAKCEFLSEVMYKIENSPQEQKESGEAILEVVLKKRKKRFKDNKAHSTLWNEKFKDRVCEIRTSRSRL